VSDDVRDAFPEPDDAGPRDDPAGPDPVGPDHLDHMDDQDDDLQDAPDLSAATPAAELERTGNPVVDSVLDSLRELDEIPVSEHVAVFEAAHDRLRGALSDAGEPPAGS
jgi:hypothetical protein